MGVIDDEVARLAAGANSFQSLMDSIAEAERVTGVRPVTGLAAELERIAPAYSRIADAMRSEESALAYARTAGFGAYADAMSRIDDPLWMPHRQLLAHVDWPSRGILEHVAAVGATLESPVMKYLRSDGVSASLLESILPAYSYASSLAAQLESPWLRAADPARSLLALERIASLSDMLHVASPYSAAAAEQLRPLLGDWSGRRPELAAYEAAAAACSSVQAAERLRLELYSGLGFDAALADIPDIAFGEVLYRAEIVTNELFVPTFRESTPKPDEEPQAFAVRSRNEAAYAIFFKLESALRVCIESELSRIAGESWTKTRVSGKLREEWIRKRKEDREGGGCERSLFAYSGFPDYLEIIGQKNNWPVFEQFFFRKDSMQESLRRLNVVRRPVMHCSPITQADFLYLVAEATRIFSALGEEFDPALFLSEEG